MKIKKGKDLIKMAEEVLQEEQGQHQVIIRASHLMGARIIELPEQKEDKNA